MEKKITVGIASFGMSGRLFHAPFLAHHPGFNMKRIVERTKSDASKLYPQVVPTRSFDELLRDDEIDLVIVNTPDNTHFDFTKKSLEAGKHVVVEKPFTQGVEQAEELIRLASRAKKVMSVFQNRRWDGDFRTVQRVVKENMLGRLVEYEARWDRYRNFIKPDTWKEEATSGAGMLTDLGSHLIDQAVVLLGMPEAVTAHLNVVRTDGEVIDWFDVRLHYPGVNAAVRGSYLALEPAPRYVLQGTLGSFIKHGVDPQEEALLQGKYPNEPGWGKDPVHSWGMLITEKEGKPFKRSIETLTGNYTGFYDNIYDCIVQGKELAVKPEEALNLMRILEAAKRSNELRKTVAMGE